MIGNYLIFYSVVYLMQRAVSAPASPAAQVVPGGVHRGVLRLAGEHTALYVPDPGAVHTGSVFYRLSDSVPGSMV